jgi:hypothetical protein
LYPFQKEGKKNKKGSFNCFQSIVAVKTKYVTRAFQQTFFRKKSLKYNSRRLQFLPMEKNPEKFVALERSTGGSFEHKQQETILFFSQTQKMAKIPQ